VAIKKAIKRKYVDWGIGWGFFSYRKMNGLGIVA